MKKEKLNSIAAVILIMLLAFLTITFSISAQTEEDSALCESEEEAVSEDGSEELQGEDEAETEDLQNEDEDGPGELQSETQTGSEAETDSETQKESESCAEETQPEDETQQDQKEETNSYTQEGDETIEETQSKEETDSLPDETAESGEDDSETESTQEETQQADEAETEEETSLTEETETESQSETESVQEVKEQETSEKESDEAVYNDQLIEDILTDDLTYYDYSYTITKSGTQQETDAEVSLELITLLISGDETDTSQIEQEIEDIKENDGVYTLTVTYTDESGSETKEEVTFTVNRYGSVYVYGEYLAGLIENGGQYVKEIEEDLVIFEYNPDMLIDGSLNIEITLDGSSQKETKLTAVYDGYETSRQEVIGWHKYEYTILSGNFTEEGVYKINISSEDEAGNSPENLNSDYEEIVFRVDCSAPEFISITGLEEEKVYANELEVNYLVCDTFGLDRVEVYVDGALYSEEKIEGDINSFSGSFTLYKKSDEQSIEIVVYDLAGNSLSTADEGFSAAYEICGSVLVSLSPFGGISARVWMIAAAAAAVLAAILILLFIKRKKKMTHIRRGYRYGGDFACRERIKDLNKH